MGESGPLPHPSWGAHSGEGSCHTRSSSPHRFVDVTLGPWVRGREGIEAWMVVGTDTRVLLPWLRSRRGQSAWVPPGPFLTACTRNQLKGSCPQVLFWGHAGLSPHPLLLPGAPCPASFPPGVGLLALVHTAGKRKWAQDPSPLPLVLSPAAWGYQALLAFLGSSALVQSPGRGYLPPKTTRIPLPGAETPSCSLEPPSALGSPGNPALPSPLAPSFLCLSPRPSLRDS